MSYNNRKLEINDRLNKATRRAVLFYVKSLINVKKENYTIGVTHAPDKKFQVDGSG